MIGVRKHELKNRQGIRLKAELGDNYRLYFIAYLPMLLCGDNIRFGCNPPNLMPSKRSMRGRYGRSWLC
jgi:hypothetical protein